MFSQRSIYYTSNTGTEEEHQVLFRSVVNFPDNYQRYCAQFPLPFLLLETPGFSELLWAPTPGPPLKLCPGDLTAPPDPQLARAMTFACLHDIIKNPTNVWWWWVEGGHMKFSQIERGEQQFFCCFQGGIKNLTESFIPFLPHPPSAKKMITPLIM